MHGTLHLHSVERNQCQASADCLCTRMQVKNIEMEAGVFAAFTQRLGIRGAVCCVTLLDRLKGDQVVTSPEDLADFDTRPGRLLRKFIKSKIA
jgi:uridine phosphorylase